MNTKDSLRTHSIVWWLLKIIGMLNLIACAALVALVPSFQALINFIELPFWLTRWVAQACVLLGAVISLWHFGLLKRDNHNLEEPQALVKDRGLFKYLRHPMYAGDMLMATGFWLIAPALITIPILLITCFALYKQACVEDAYLQSRFAAVFTQWQASSYLLWPKF